MTNVPGKPELRSEFKARLAALPEELRASYSRDLARKIPTHDVWKKSAIVLLYCAIQHEPDLSPLFRMAFEEGKKVALPRYSAETKTYVALEIASVEEHCAPGMFGVMEPVASCREVDFASIELALVPGLAFSETGWRLGRGKGFYDRLLALITGVRCGVAFDEQIVSSLPVEKHDTKLDMLLTPGRCIVTMDLNR